MLIEKLLIKFRSNKEALEEKAMLKILFHLRKFVKNWKLRKLQQKKREKQIQNMIDMQMFNLSELPQTILSP